MHVKEMLKSGGMTALAAAMAITALPAEAMANSDNKRNWNNDNRSARVERSGDVRANRIDNRSERRAERVERRADIRAEQVQNRTNNASPSIERAGDRRAAQIERNAERRAAQIERRGDIRAAQVDARSERQADRIERRDSRAAANRDRIAEQNRNRTYNDRDRNRTYTDRNRDRDDRRYDRRHTYRDGRHDDRRWDHRWRDNNRYNWYNYRNSHRNLYRTGRYYSPYSHWSYRRLTIGFFLDSLFYSNRYWISDPYNYRLPPAYGPYRWVRYYDDVLLVNIYSGEVVDVIYDFFW